MIPVPPPVVSPAPPDPGPEGDSGVHLLTAREAREKMQTMLAVAKREGEKEAAERQGQAEAEAFWRRVWAIGTSGAVLILGTVGVLAWGQSKLDAGVAPLREELAEHKKAEAESVGKLDSRLGTVERSSIRTEAMVEMLVNNRGLKAPPKQPKDSGE